MNFKNLTISLALIAIFALLTIVIASPILEYLLHGTGTVTETKAAIYVDGAPYGNGTTLDWGSMARGETYYANFTVQNTGTTTFKVVLQISEIPIGISYKWLANNTVLAPGEYAKADLDLIVDLTATLGTYSMGNYHVILETP